MINTMVTVIIYIVLCGVWVVWVVLWFEFVGLIDRYFYRRLKRKEAEIRSRYGRK
jgi:hypothetical protein